MKCARIEGTCALLKVRFVWRASLATRCAKSATVHVLTTCVLAATQVVISSRDERRNKSHVSLTSWWRFSWYRAGLSD